MVDKSQARKLVEKLPSGYALPVPRPEEGIVRNPADPDLIVNWDELVVKQFIDYVGQGVPVRIAAEAVGWTVDEVGVWMYLAEKGDPRFKGFDTLIRTTLAKAEADLVTAWYQMSKSSVPGVSSFLARRFPSRWGQSVEGAEHASQTQEQMPSLQDYNRLKDQISEYEGKLLEAPPPPLDAIDPDTL